MTQDTLFKQHGADTQVDGKDRDCWMLGPLLGTQALRASACTYGDPCAPPGLPVPAVERPSLTACLAPRPLHRGPGMRPSLTGDINMHCSYRQTHFLSFTQQGHPHPGVPFA